MTRQIETATVAGTITLGGNASVIISGAYITTTTVSVAVTLSDTASQVAEKIRNALGLTAAVTEQYAVSGSGVYVALTDHTDRANDTTLNIAIDNDTCTGLTPAATSANTLAGDGIENGYCTLAEFKSYVGLTGTDEDTLIEKIINAVSRYIDSVTGRRFYTTSADEVRYYTADNSRDVFPGDDILSITTLKTDDAGDRSYGTTWLTTDYELEPMNSLPKLWITTTPNGTKWFPTYRNAVQVTGKFGYSAATPDAIRQACLIQTNRIRLRKGTPFGVAGSSSATGETYVTRSLDPDVEEMIGHYRRIA